MVIQVGDEEVPIGIHANSDGKPERSGDCRTTIATKGKLSVAGYGGDDSGGGVHAADAAVVGVGDEEVAVGVQGHARGMVQRSNGGKAAIPAEGKSTIAGDSGNDSSGSIHTADAAVLRVGDEEIAVAIKGDFARLNLPGEIAFDSNGNLFIADSQNGRIRRGDGYTPISTIDAGAAAIASDAKEA